MDSIISDSIRCGAQKGDTGGVIRVSQAEKICGVRGELRAAEWVGEGRGPSTPLRMTVYEVLIVRRSGLGPMLRAKKCGAEGGDPNLRFQPRLPGSVVGEASMRQVRWEGKITKVTV